MAERSSQLRSYGVMMNESILKSRKFWYSISASGTILAGLWVCGTYHLPDLTGAAALAGIAAAWGLSVHHQGAVDKIEAGKGA